MSDAPVTIRRLFLAAGLVSGLTIAASGPVAAKNLTLGSTNATSSHYQIAIGMAKAIEAGVPGTTVSLVETGASVDNVRRLMRGEIDLGLVASDVFVQAQTGTGAFKDKPVADLVALYPYDSSIINIAVRADSGVTKLEDLKGRKFSPGIRGSGGEALISQAFGLLGIKPDYIYGNVTDAVEGVTNKQLVGYNKYAAADRVDAALQELMTSTKMRILGFTPEQQAVVRQNIKGVGFIDIPAGFIPDNPAFSTPSVPIVYATRTKLMDDDTAFQVAKAIHANRQYLIDVWPQLKDYNFAKSILATQEIGVTIHPGAKRYWASAP